MLLKPAPHRLRTFMLIVSVFLFMGALTLLVMGQRTFGAWVLLASTFANLVLSILLWRARSAPYVGDRVQR